MLSYFDCFSVFVWTGQNDSNTQRVDAYFFFESGEKISDFKNIWMRMQGAKVNKPCADRGLSESSEEGKLPETSQMSGLLLRCPTTFILRYNTVTINNKSEIQIKIPGGHVLSMVRSFRGENNLEQCLDIAW